MIFLLQHLSSETADLYALVLTAEGIAHRAVKTWSGWSLAVSQADSARAILAIDRYRAENPETRAPEAADPAAHALRQASW